MRHLAAVFGFVWVVVGLGACGDENRQTCAPGEAELCAEGEVCTVDHGGNPVCAAPGPLEEGALCRAADAAEADGRCAAGLGCLRVAGVSRCLRFCDPSLDVDPCVPEGNRPIVPGAGPEQLRNYARCAGVLPDRPEIGVCILPCRPDRIEGCVLAGVCSAYPDDCPARTVCGLSPQAPIPLCVPAGIGTEGQICSAERGCSAGLLCARIDGEARCRLATNVRDACPPNRRKVPLAGVSDPQVVVEDRVEEVCVQGGVTP